jgi:hypothetical protein
MCDACGHGKFSDTKGATVCTDCAAGNIQTQEVGTGCTPCTPGRSTNGVEGSTAEFCPECAVHYYCGREGCPECTECTIAEYTDGRGATEADQCMTFSAVFGLKYPGQCTLFWIIAGGILFMVVVGWVVKCYLHGGGNTASVQPVVDATTAKVDEAANEEEPKKATDNEPDRAKREDTKLLAFVF